MILLDGSMGSELKARGVVVPSYETSLWSAQSLIGVPGRVTELHQEYIRSGANVITANNYAVTPVVLAREHMNERLEDMTLTACALARNAKEREDSSVKIAASLPPLNTSYRVDLVAPYEENLSTYRMLAKLLEPHVDLLICETMTTAAEAQAAAQAGVETGLPVWVSWTLSDDPISLRSGETISQAVAALADLPISAFLFNCSSADAISSALPLLRECTDKPIGGYANPFRKEPTDDNYDADSPNWLDPEAYAKTAKGWIEAGATILGGCCGTNPSYIEALRRMRDRMPKLSASTL